MKRARLIIKEVQVSKQGEIKVFQIKLPKNVERIIAIETDVRMDSFLEDDAPSDGGTIHAPYLFWTLKANPVLGKLKLKSMERAGIFYEEWLHFIRFNGGMPDISMALFAKNPTSINRNRVPKKVDVPRETTLINGLFEDTIGISQLKDIRYTIKIFVWAETTEEANGVVFDFQND